MEATVRASVGVNRNGPRTLARSSQDEDVAERAASGVNRNGPRTLGREEETPDMSGIFKPAGRPGAAFAPRDEQEEDDRPALARMAPRQEPRQEPRQAPSRPAGRPGAFRASRNEEESSKPQKNVPI